MMIEVETRPNAVGDPEPRSFRIGARRYDVLDVLDRWLGAERGYFKIRADDGAIYILRFDVGSRHWEIALYESGHRPDVFPSRGVKRPH